MSGSRDQALSNHGYGRSFAVGQSRASDPAPIPVNVRSCSNRDPVNLEISYGRYVLFVQGALYEQYSVSKASLGLEET
jgi:hypothetical protein